MSNNYPYDNNGRQDETRQYRRQEYGQGYDRSYDQNYRDGYPQPQYQEQYQQQYQEQYRQQDNGPTLLAGKFDPKKVAVNLVLLGVLAAVVTFAIVLIVDQIIARITGDPAQGPGQAVITGVIAGIIGVLAGLLYVPVSGTGNEGLFNAAIVALTVAAAVFYVLFGGLLDKDWTTILTLAAILCAGVTASAAPTRIEAARVR
jgi:hypothetical protein